MAVRILSRSTWTSTTARGRAFDWSRIRGIVAHYPAMGADVGVLSQAEEEALIRAWRNFHVNVLGWSDLGYNWVIAQSGRVYTGRGARVAAHAVGHNSTTAGVLFIAGDNETLTPAAEAAFRALRVSLRRKGAGAGVWGHREMSGNSTRCPGPKIMGSIRAGRLTSGSTPKPRPGDPSRPWRSSPRVAGMSAAEVREIQETLLDLGYSLGSWGVDGSYGDATGTAVKALQHDLGVTADGIYGPSTQEALMSKLDDLDRKLDRLIAFGEQIHWRTDTVGQRVLDAPVDLLGIDEGKTSNLRTKIAWQHNDFRQILATITSAQTAILKAITESAKEQGVSDAALERIVDAVARVSAKDVADELKVGVKED